MATRENFSRKREAIYQAVCSTTVHPTAEWVFRRVQPECPEISLGTVYRNLHRLCDGGKLRSVGVIDGHEHFDGNLSAHSHFVCEACGAVLDIFEPLLPPETEKQVEQTHGFEIHHQNILFSGICPTCRKTAEK